jgi:Ca2+-binding EF-hand superfamily protein
MTLETMPTPGEMWDMMQKASKGSKIGSQMFTSFLHWMCVKTVAKTLAEMKTDGLVPGLPPLPEDEFGNLVMPVGPGQDFKIPKKDIFELCVDMIDSVVVSLAPDLFRCIDTNNDGDMSKEEWEALIEVLTAPNPDKALDFIFTIMDKDSSKTIQVDEVASFFRKILKIILEVARSAVHIVGRLIIQSTQQMLADQIFDQMDKDKDGLLTPDEIFMGFPPPLLQAVGRVFIHSCYFRTRLADDCLHSVNVLVCVVERLTHALFEQVMTYPDLVNCALTVLEGGLSEVEGDISDLLPPGSLITLDNQGGSILKELKSNFLCLPADMRTRLSRFIAFAKETGNSIMSWKGGLDKDFFFTKFKIYAVGLFKQTFEALQTLIVADSECAAMVQMKIFSNCIDEMNAVSASFLMLVMGSPFHFYAKYTQYDSTCRESSTVS